MKFDKIVSKLCTPAYLYFFISTIVFVIVLTQNIFNGKINEFCAGSYKCNVSNVLIIFIFKSLYISLWTYILNALCKYGYEKISWFIILFPFLLSAVLIGLLFLNDM